MNKKLILIFVILLAGVFFFQACGQADMDTHDLFKEFPVLKFRDFFYQDVKRMYYRFPTYVPFFDPIDLGYFPHETWRESDWSLLERWRDTWTYHQLIMLSEPAKSWIFHGTDVGKEYRFLDDFYLYATLFVSDNYPEKSGSCYVYYSDSLVKGFGESSGILVDPQSGIFQVNNIYGASYNLTNKSHEMNLIHSFKEGEFPVISEEDIEGSSYAASDFRYEIMDEHFEKDWKAVKKEFHMPGSEIRVYRLELIREGTKLRVYINGKLTVEKDDGIVSVNEAGETRPGMVSWSFGPVLYTGGETVTCAVGDFYVYGKAQKE